MLKSVHSKGLTFRGTIKDQRLGLQALHGKSGKGYLTAVCAANLVMLSLWFHFIQSNCVYKTYICFYTTNQCWEKRIHTFCKMGQAWINTWRETRGRDNDRKWSNEDKLNWRKFKRKQGCQRIITQIIAHLLRHHAQQWLSYIFETKQRGQSARGKAFIDFIEESSGLRDDTFCAGSVRDRILRLWGKKGVCYLFCIPPFHIIHRS